MTAPDVTTDRSAAYLERIGASADDPLDVLVDHHLHSVPFENLAIHLGEGVHTDPDALYDKIVLRRRGGFCHELNGAFADLLTALGHDVVRLGGQVYADEGLTAPLSHHALLVDGTWVVDVGFGRHGVGPEELTTSPVLVAVEHGDLDVLGPSGAPSYRLDLHPRRREDFVPVCSWQATSPDSWFTHAPLCSLPLRGGGRDTLHGRTLIRTSPAGERSERELAEDEVLAAYRDLFGVDVDRVPVALNPPGT